MIPLQPDPRLIVSNGGRSDPGARPARLVVTPETRDQIRGLTGRDELPELPCKIVVNPHMPEGMAYLFDATLLRAAMDAPEQQDESVAEPHAFAVGDELGWELPPEPPPGSIVKEHGPYSWSRDGSGQNGWSVGSPPHPDETDNGMTWADVLERAAPCGAVTVVRVGWPTPPPAAPRDAP